VKLDVKFSYYSWLFLGREGEGGHILYQKTSTKFTELCTTDVKFRVKVIVDLVNSLTLSMKWTCSSTTILCVNVYSCTNSVRWFVYDRVYV